METTQSSMIETFAKLLHEERLRGLIASHVDCEGNRLNCVTRIKVGRKYANVDVGHSGAYMVELATGAIYGIKGYGVIHRGHYYGTLDTINEWDWSEYRAFKRQDKAA